MCHHIFHLIVHHATSGLLRPPPPKHCKFYNRCKMPYVTQISISSYVTQISVSSYVTQISVSFCRFPILYYNTFIIYIESCAASVLYNKRLLIWLKGPLIYGKKYHHINIHHKCDVIPITKGHTCETLCTRINALECLHVHVFESILLAYRYF